MRGNIVGVRGKYSLCEGGMRKQPCTSGTRVRHVDKWNKEVGQRHKWHQWGVVGGTVRQVVPVGLGGGTVRQVATVRTRRWDSATSGTSGTRRWDSATSGNSED